MARGFILLLDSFDIGASDDAADYGSRIVESTSQVAVCTVWRVKMRVAQ